MQYRLKNLWYTNNVSKRIHAEKRKTKVKVLHGYKNALYGGTENRIFNGVQKYGTHNELSLRNRICKTC